MPKGLLTSIVKRKHEIYLWVRISENQKVRLSITDFRPYFYVPSVFGEYKALDGKTVERIYLDDPSKVPEVREQYPKHYEADIPYVRRFLIDTGIKKCLEYNSLSPSWKDIRPTDCNIWPRIWYIDIEVLANTFPDPNEPKYPIIAITVYDNYLDEYITWLFHEKLTTAEIVKENISINKNYVIKKLRIKLFQSEEEMLNDFVNTWQKVMPDIVTGWNVNFDIEYLSSRLVVHNMYLDTSFTDRVDLLLAYKVIGPKRRSYKLKHVTVEEGIESREEAREAADVLPHYKEDPSAVLIYNVKDVWRIVIIDKRYKLIDYLLNLKWVTGIESISSFLSPTENIMGRFYRPAQLIDTYLLRLAKELGIVLPSKPKNAKKLRYKGAIVFPPKKGLHENVAVFDMSRYYPSIIISFNISPETKIKRIGEIALFKQEPEGLLPKMAKRLLEEREKLEQERMKYEPGTPEYEAIENKIRAIKGLINAIYGTTGYEKFRLYDIDVASTVTALAREGLIFIANKAEERGYKVIYGDTDSIFIQVDFDKAQELANELTVELRRYFMRKYGLKKEPKLKLKFEKYYERIFFKEAKKRYAGLLVWKKGKKMRELDITGFEAIKSDSAPITAEMERELFLCILNGELDKVNEVIKKYVEEAKSRPLDDIALYKTLRKPLDQYSSNSPHVRAAIWANTFLGTKFGYGSRVKMIWVKRVIGLPPTNVVAYEDEEQIRDKIIIDWTKQLDAIIYGPARIILEPLGIRVSTKVNRISKWL